MLRGLDLFSGYGGISIGLRRYVRPLLYCEIETYAQGILISRMADEHIPFAPIWNDVTSLDGSKLRGMVDIIYGGFPCQDISTAGHGKGLAGERSGLFYEIVRLTKEINPAFVFLENVPAIRTRGLREVIRAFTKMGYDCRWTCISASSVGANHKRERWFLLAHAQRSDVRLKSRGIIRKKRKGSIESRVDGQNGDVANTISIGTQVPFNGQHSTIEISGSSCEIGENSQLANSDLQRCGGEATTTKKEDNEGIRESDGRPMSSATDSSWWAFEPCVGRVAHGIAFRAHRIKALGNGVVPLQVEKAFEKLMGLSHGS